MLHDLTPPMGYTQHSHPDLCHLLHIKAQLFNQPVHQFNATTLSSKVQQCPFILYTYVQPIKLGTHETAHLLYKH